MGNVRAFSLRSLLNLAAPAALAIACSSSPPAVPQAGMSVTVEPGDNSSTKCPIVGQVWNIGGSSLAPVANGQDDSGGFPVTVTCSVTQQGSGYSVTGDVLLSGSGSFTITGTFDGTTNPQSNISATFVLPNGLGNWSEGDCAVTFPDAGHMGIAAGRVWAQVDCPSMVDASNNTTCEGIAEFRLENCNQ
jgi:hypothetical protein